MAFLGTSDVMVTSVSGAGGTRVLLTHTHLGMESEQGPATMANFDLQETRIGPNRGQVSLCNLVNFPWKAKDFHWDGMHEMGVLLQGHV